MSAVFYIAYVPIDYVTKIPDVSVAWHALLIALVLTPNECY